jgi:hypothetical protein
MKKMNSKTAATKMTMMTATMTATRSERAFIHWAMCPASRLMGYACAGIRLHLNCSGENR